MGEHATEDGGMYLWVGVCRCMERVSLDKEIP